MKLVIDIPEKAYKRIQSLSNADYFGHDTYGNSMRRIANGTPYEERPHGEWEGHVERRNLNTRKCTSCGEYGAVGYFCMWCGADMRREGDEK